MAVSPRTGRAKWCFALACAAIPLLVIGTGLAVWHIETIIFSGACMFIYCGLLLFLTTNRGLPQFRWFAWLGLAFPIAIFLLIFLMSWSPGEAKVPVSCILAVMTLFASVGLVHSLIQHHRDGVTMGIREAIREHAESAEIDVTSEQPTEPDQVPDQHNPFVASDQRW